MIVHKVCHRMVCVLVAATILFDEVYELSDKEESAHGCEARDCNLTLCYQGGGGGGQL